MTQIRHHVTANGSIEDAFDLVNDYRMIPKWMFGITSFTPITDVTRGLGATFESAMKIGPKSLKSTMEVVEYVEGEVVCLKAVRGVDVTTRWAFSESDEEGKIRVDVDFDYSLGGGLAGRALSAVVEPVVGQAIKQTERDLTKLLEERSGS
ncbi:MAG: SRPBCC family protein [Gordonia sp. (in: high G+C Gram-positive bacteria)]